MHWHSIHVHYHDPAGHDDLIGAGVQPLFAAVAGELAGGYFLRHWRQGPHLRLDVCTEPDRFAEVVLPAAEEILGQYLAARPSRAAADPETLLPLHQRLAALEHEPGPLLPWQPDNSIQSAPCDRRLAAVGSEAAADLRAEFLTATTPLAFQLTDQLRAGRQRLRLAFDLMVAVAHSLSGVGITGGYLSYRSHAEVYLCLWPEGVGRRESWDEWYHQHADQLMDRVRTVVASLDQGTPSLPLVAAWVAAVRPFRSRARELIESGAIAADHLPDGWDPARLGMRPALAASPFHRMLAADETFTERVAPSAWFGTWRLLLNYQYLQLTRLGITPGERFLLAHLVANAVEECYRLPVPDLAGHGAGR